MSRNKKVFIVDDDPNISGLISLYLSKEGYTTTEFLSGKEMLTKFSENIPDLILLDIMLPEMDGYEVLREIRKISKVPVIMVTAKNDTFDKVLGLELGADDYMVKPFDPKEMLARVKAVIRRYSDTTDDSNVLVLPNLIINMTDFNLTYFGKKMEIPPKEMELLYHLASHPNRVFTREQLLDQIWGYDYIGETRTVDVHIKRLREKLSNQTEWEIKTVWGVGYKFRLDK
ncbi:response regulator transcription factor [Helicovermis profundi]|uniref:Stage 0 sporulation protein A homolog n=1 Tax=Helicovermis profundi TaxID=3065157 RepID=A0AAU9EBI4_9FIRM|nr:response regulator transcription factor [Clostridia bacterium S502]